MDGGRVAGRLVTIHGLCRAALTEPGMAGVLWLALPDTPDKDIGLSYFGVVSETIRYSNGY